MTLGNISTMDMRAATSHLDDETEIIMVDYHWSASTLLRRPVAVHVTP